MKVLQMDHRIQGWDNEETNGVAHCDDIHLITRLSATLWALLRNLSASTGWHE
jgi:hypothetical protein